MRDYRKNHKGEVSTRSVNTSYKRERKHLDMNGIYRMNARQVQEYMAYLNARGKTIELTGRGYEMVDMTTGELQEERATYVTS